MRSLLPSAALLAGAVLVISGCQDPIFPESEGPLLHTAPAAFNSVMVNAVINNGDVCHTPFPPLPDETLVFEDCVSPQTLTDGDLVGPGGAVTFDGMIDPMGNGEAEGTILYTATVAGMSGDFEGTFEGEFTGGVFNGTLRLRGRTGGVDGIHIRATFAERVDGDGFGTNIFDFVGTIRFPEGEDDGGVATGEADLDPLNESGIEGEIEFTDDGSTLTIDGEAEGMDPTAPPNTYISLIYDNGSVATGPDACEPVLGLSDMFVGVWVVDEDGEGTLAATNPNALGQFRTMSIRDTRINGGFGPLAVAACGVVETDDDED